MGYQNMAAALLIRGANMKRQVDRSSGFTLAEMVVVAAIIAIIAGMAVPLLINSANAVKLSQSARGVERELQTARLQAVQSNQPMRVQFNCPVSGAFRMVEMVGTASVPAAADSAANRCALTSFPYPADTDKNPLTRPNFDGPLRYVDPSVSFSVVTTIEFWPDGTAHTNTGGTNPWPVIGVSGQSISVTRSGVTKTILVNGLGKVQLQ